MIDGSLHWSLLSAMNLNYLSLHADADALKQVIANFDRHAIHHPQMVSVTTEADAIERLTRLLIACLPAYRCAGWRPPCPIRSHRLSAKGEMYLLGAVLSRLSPSLYASVDSFTADRR
ncbi:type VI secretion system baseplate subunit TssF [Salmonella enterica subsp. enterica serovar Weltevreden]|nr:type VI secretion system baseplate subunit TssF [Salmonella enterica subsp. enterica serovar Weltevreden]